MFRRQKKHIGRHDTGTAQEISGRVDRDPQETQKESMSETFHVRRFQRGRIRKLDHRASGIRSVPLSRHVPVPDAHASKRD